MAKSCPKCDANGIGHPELVESGFPAPCNLKCPVCKDGDGKPRYFDSKGVRHWRSKVSERAVKDPDIDDWNNPGRYLFQPTKLNDEYTSAFANQRIPRQAIQDLLWRYRHFDINYSIYRIASEFDINPGIVRAEAAKRCERETPNR